MRAFIVKHPVGSYFALAFALSWIGVLAVIWPPSLPAPAAEAERLFTWVYLSMLVGPPVAGIVMTAITSGRPGLAAYRQRLVHWRVPLKWYAVAMLTAPLTLCVTLFGLWQVSDAYAPSILSNFGSAM